MQRFFTEPYDFVKPVKSTFWVRLMAPMVPGVTRSAYRVDKWVFQKRQNLTEAKAANGGILLAPNHCRLADPALCGLMAVDQGLFNYYMASWHLFKQPEMNWWTRWKLTRLGGFSIFREGTDRDALREASRILAEETRPLVIFPEGTWARQSDRILPLLEGVSLIVRKAVKQAKHPVCVIPTAVRYWYLTDPRPELSRRLGVLEKRLRWEPQEHLEFIPRIEKLTSVLLAIKETEFFGQQQSADIDTRINRLVEAILSRAETGLFGRSKTGLIMDRVRNVTRAQVQKLQQASKSPADEAAIRAELRWTCLAQDLAAHDLNYLRAWPTFERIGETVVRIEEALDGDELPSTLRMGAVLEMGKPMWLERAPDFTASQLRQFGEPDVVSPDQVMELLADRLRTMVHDLIVAGPPPEWQIPADPVRSKQPQPPLDESLPSTRTVALA